MNSVLVIGNADPSGVIQSLKQQSHNFSAPTANLVFRREETAAMRSQANTAKLLQDNVTLMRLRELEVLEKGGRELAA